MTPETLAARLHAQRSKSHPSSIEDCRRDAEEALAIAGGTVPSYVTGVRIAGERVERNQIPVKNKTHT